MPTLGSLAAGKENRAKDRRAREDPRSGRNSVCMFLLYGCEVSEHFLSGGGGISHSRGWKTA